jgi:hypothetical protein
MIRIPSFIGQPLSTLSSSHEPPLELRGAAAGLLRAERRLELVSRSIDSFREAMRSLGLLEESRNGQNVQDSWLKISRYFLAPIFDGEGFPTEKATEYVEAPRGSEETAARWERLVPEMDAFVSEERALEKLFASTPVSAHAGFRCRSRLLLLDRRAERIKITLDLVRRDLLDQAQVALDRLHGALEDRDRPASAPRVKPKSKPEAEA